jgi:hypothetical protein
VGEIGLFVPMLKLHVKRFLTKLFKEIYAIIRSTETDPRPIIYEVHS